MNETKQVAMHFQDGEQLVVELTPDQHGSYPYAWVITRDRSAELSDESAEPGTNSNAVGIAGPHDAPDVLLDLAKAGKGIRFRMMDEGDIDECNYDHKDAVGKNHELYGVVYEGVLVDPMGHWPWGPLDDFGRGNYGCTDIQLYNDVTGSWEWL